MKDKDYSGEGKQGGDPGLQLLVRSGDAVKDNVVPVGEIKSVRDDIMYGSFRASMKVTDVNGTCAAFFFVSPLLSLQR